MGSGEFDYITFGYNRTTTVSTSTIRTSTPPTNTYGPHTAVTEASSDSTDGTRELAIEERSNRNTMTPAEIAGSVSGATAGVLALLGVCYIGVHFFRSYDPSEAQNRRDDRFEFNERNKEMLSDVLNAP
eukprot:Protomagalhaensia_wolfi_Nauph_80__1097@NODE_1640_length_1427_cov_94_275937_g1269_i0_p3_GENE_NODE_1640_length_1427_cov_94_275937_g1269_i0NODE_1640_length_1427_cov_94_275937_g1269_i0_p3_ORF_typecomplete_len129_score4_39Podoplanin/PF05808_11/0_005DUF5305/PF17231_2/0_0075Mid2/PF04478_12/1_3_NODE_1640_length_1427_cov_94_275937_g1269_i09691355